MITDTWFAGSFCPRGATCSEGAGALTPSNGPKIRTAVFDPPITEFLPATVFQFSDEASFIKLYTNSSDWLKCEGQVVEIVQYQALFSLLGTMYGGDGRTTFGLPDLRHEDNSEGDYYIKFDGFTGYGP